MRKQKIIYFFDSFFTQFSKIVVILPIIILILGIWIKYSSSNKKNPSMIDFFPSPTRVKISPSLPQKSSREKFNLTGPLICQYQTKESSTSAFIKNKKILIKTRTKNEIKNFLISDDCLYLWQEKKYNGERLCGIGGYLNLVQSLPFFNFSDFLKGNEFNNQFGKSFDFNNLLNSCQKKEIEEELFLIPKNIIFKNISLNELNP